MSYEYIPLPYLRAGMYFMFSQGATILYCYHAERNLVIYKNMITGKCRRLKGFINDKDGVCSVRYVKSLNRMFDKYYADRAETEDLPF